MADVKLADELSVPDDDDDEQELPETRTTEDVRRSVRARLAVAELTDWREEYGALLRYLRLRGQAIVLGLAPARMVDYTLWLRQSGADIYVLRDALRATAEDMAVITGFLGRANRKVAAKGGTHVKQLDRFWSPRELRLLKLYVPYFVQTEFVDLASDLLGSGWDSAGALFSGSREVRLTPVRQLLSHIAEYLPPMPHHIAEILEHMEPEWRPQFSYLCLEALR